MRKKADEAAYLQIYRTLRERIVRGDYPYGTRLPSKRALAAAHGVSVITAEHAYAILCDEGYAKAREKVGYFAIFHDGETGEKIDTPQAPRPAATLHSSGSEFPLSVLARTMRRVLTEEREAILVKSPNNGSRRLREAIASYLARSRDIVVRPSQVVIGSGAESLYSLIAQMIGQGATFAVEDPCYEKIRRVYAANGMKIEPLRMGADGIRSDELARSGADALHVTPFHSFPSGISAGASKRQEYLRWVAERGRVLIEDDFDSEFSPSPKAEDTLFSADRSQSVIYLNTFSKTIAPSFRVGYMVMPERWLARYTERVGFYSCTVPMFEQYVIAALLDGGDFERHIHRQRRRRRQRQP